MGRLDRLRQARREAQEAALKRWRERADEREQTRAKLAAGGVGAADSPQRVARYRQCQ